MNTAHHGGSKGFDRLHRIGVDSWSLLGLIALTVVIAAGIGTLSGILVPLVVAVILGTVLEPLTALLGRLRVPPVLSATIGLFVAVLAIVGILIVVVRGFIVQMPEISEQVMLGWQYAVDWARSLDIEASLLERWRSMLTDIASWAGLGLLSFLTDTVYGVISFGIGSFFALFFLFFVLRDGRFFPGWLARITGQDRAAVTQVDAQVRQALRGYFKGIAVTAVITAPIFAIPLVLLGIPLIIPILILYFFLSFVPFLGACITGAFAVLIAFGSGGPTAALIVAISLLVSNGTVQSAVSPWALGSSLKMHPVMVLLATLIGGVVAGIIGMVLGAPLLAAAQNSIASFRSDPVDEPEQLENGDV